jgi:hypothetical protein
MPEPIDDKRKFLAEHIDGELLCADGFDDAIIGTVCTFGGNPIVLYNRTRCIEILIEEGMTHEDAEDHFCFNVEGSYVGEQTPMYAILLEDYPC